MLAGVAALTLGQHAALGNFDVSRAQRKIRELEQTYRSTYDRGTCPYYGRWWANHYARRSRLPGSQETVWDHYRKLLAQRGQKPQRLDCTLYAQEVLQAGMDPAEYQKLLQGHRRIWGPRGFAGWSVGHLLTTEHGWKAYAIVRPGARYYSYYLKHLRRGVLPVWKQPSIKIEQHFIVGQHDRAIEALLRRGRLGWGFSDGGIHTWVTSGVDLKECHWDSAPSKALEIPGIPAAERQPFFETTRLLNFADYGVHLVVFPPDS
jgi:hypothetical protein